MENTLAQLMKEANKPKHAAVRKLCQEALGKCSAIEVYDKDNFACCK